MSGFNTNERVVRKQNAPKTSAKDHAPEDLDIELDDEFEDEDEHRGRRNRKREVVNVNSLIGGGLMSRSLNGESIQAYSKVFHEIIEKQPNLKGVVKIIPVGRDDAQAPLASLAITLQYNKTLFAFLMIVEGSGPALRPRAVSTGRRGDEILIPTVPGELYNDDYWKAVAQVLGRNLAKDMKVLDAGAIVLPNTLDPEDTHRLHNVLQQAINGIEIARDAEYPDDKLLVNNLSIPKLKHMYFNTTLLFNPGNAETVTGQPLRRDVAIVTTMSETKRVRDDDSLRSGSVELSRAGGYVEFQYVGDDDDYYYNDRERDRDRGRERPCFSPKFILTQTDFMTEIHTLGTALMAINSASVLAHEEKGRAWNRIFTTRFGSSARDPIKSLAGLMLERDGGKITVDVNDVDFDATIYLRHLVDQSLHYAHQIQQTGDYNFVNDIILRAAQGDRDARKAIDAEISFLIGKDFSEYYDVMSRPIASMDGTVLFGEWRDADGVRRPIQELDQLAAYNFFGTKDIETAQRYADTFDPTTGALEEEQIRERVEILNLMTNGTVVITGRGDQFTYESEFIEALNEAMFDAGFEQKIEQLGRRDRNYDRGRRELLGSGITSDRLRVSRSNRESRYKRHTRHR